MNRRLPHNPDYTRLIILRHAQTALNIDSRLQGVTDALLDRKGRHQAKKLADALSRSYAIDHIFTSPYPRAQETAGYVARKYGIEFEPTPDLAELGFGIAENERYIDLKTKAPDFYDGINRLYELDSLAGSGKPSYPEGESVPEIRARLEHFTQRLLSAYQGKCVAAVSHGGFIKYMVAYYLGLPLEQPIFITINNASISIVDFLGKRVIVRCFNETGHLRAPISYSRPTVL